MRNTLLGMFVGCLLLLTGCGPSITSGDVCDKQFEPAHDVTSLAMSPDGESFTTETDHIPDRWWVSFRRADEKNGGWIVRTVRVTKETHDTTNIGDFFDTGEE